MARPKGIFTKFSPEAAERARATIQTNRLIKRLQAFSEGEIEMKSAAVTAALGLLRKVVPDLTAIEHSGEIDIPNVIRAPEIASTIEDWEKNHTPLQRTEH